MLSTGAADGDNQLAFLLVVAVERNHVVDEVIEPRQESLRLGRAQHIVAHRLVQPGHRPQLRVIEGVRQAADVKHQIRVHRHPKLKPEGDAVDHKVVLLRVVAAEQVVDVAAQLGGGKQCGVDNHVRPVLDGAQQLPLPADSLGQRPALPHQRMGAAGDLIAVDQLVVGRVQKENLIADPLPVQLG